MRIQVEIPLYSMTCAKEQLSTSPSCVYSPLRAFSNSGCTILWDQQKDIQTTSLMFLVWAVADVVSAVVPLDGSFDSDKDSPARGTGRLNDGSIPSSFHVVIWAQTACVSSVVVRRWLTWLTSAPWWGRTKGWPTGSGWRSVGRTRVLLLLGSGWSTLTWCMPLWPPAHLFMLLSTSQVQRDIASYDTHTHTLISVFILTFIKYSPDTCHSLLDEQRFIPNFIIKSGNR